MKAQYPRKRRRKRKCRCCGELYLPEARHFRDQEYCPKAECRRGSKRASQWSWLMSEKGAEYRDPEENKRRVREVKEEGEYYYDFANLPFDVDGDGWTDIIVGNFRNPLTSCHQFSKYVAHWVSQWTFCKKRRNSGMGNNRAGGQ